MRWSSKYATSLHKSAGICRNKPMLIVLGQDIAIPDIPDTEVPFAQLGLKCLPSQCSIRETLFARSDHLHWFQTSNVIRYREYLGHSSVFVRAHPVQAGLSQFSSNPLSPCILCLLLQDWSNFGKKLWIVWEFRPFSCDKYFVSPSLEHEWDSSAGPSKRLHRNLIPSIAIQVLNFIKFLQILILSGISPTSGQLRQWLGVHLALIVWRLRYMLTGSWRPKNRVALLIARLVSHYNW